VDERILAQRTQHSPTNQEHKATNWQWLWTAILVPVGVWGWRKWKERREQRSARTPPQNGGS